MPKRRVNATDTIIGERLRALRKARGISQTEVGDAIGVKFQQIQKFELGNNRIAASQLYELAKFFSIPISEFLPATRSGGKHEKPAKPDPKVLAALEFAASKQGFELTRALSSLDEVQRGCLVEYVKALAKRMPSR